jgi:hypothetical protein
MITRGEDRDVTSLSERLVESVLWFVAVGREFWLQRVLRRPAAGHYTGRHRLLKTESQYREDPITQAIIVKTRSWRTPASVFRSHVSRVTARARRAKEPALAVYTGRVSASTVALIATMTIFMEQNALWQQAMHPTGV